MPPVATVEWIFNLENVKKKIELPSQRCCMKKIVTDTKLQKLGSGKFKASVVLIELCLFNSFRRFHYFISGGGRRYSITTVTVWFPSREL